MALTIALLLAFFVLGAPWNVLVVVAGALVEVGELWWGLRLARGRPRAGREALAGRRGRVVRALAPAGQVQLDGERWTARSADGGSVPLGAEVEVVAVEGISLVVRPAAP